MIGELEAVEAVALDSRGSDTEAGFMPVSLEMILEYVRTLMDSVDELVQKAKALLLRFQEAISHAEYDLGCATAVKHKIDISGNRHFRQALWRHPTAMVEAIDMQVDVMLRANIVGPS